MNKSITIVTAFFDIGRGDWTVDNGHPNYLHRTAETYLSNFSNLASLDNEMIVFTSSDLVERIQEIRAGKPTKVIAVDLRTTFGRFRKKITEIQNDAEFKKLISPQQAKNPEYWSPDYALVCNLKSYFVMQAIKLGSIKNNLVAWVDFGYCRSAATLDGIKNWYYPFDDSKVNLFTIRKQFSLKTMNDVLSGIFNNNVFIIGGAIVGSVKHWGEFHKLVWNCQRYLLQRKIIDDDQGVFLMCYYKNKELIRLNYLGDNKWFSLFKVFHRRNSVAWKIKNRLRVFRGK
ncbi:protein YibB [Buttiauxella agrestis]|uniref:Lipopolysaccharide biosynthesis protein n=1 Tax=Buttiauxella agrestis ATCC 33320 TaxID=1006004 RepID=A0A085FZ92_9ENTR|nr:protein YibB [Buttiauxella agrestis]KFC76787.1 lipopolysaccharide biosynthesis protein [Buttiauxella agrestis ATCC 33320]